MSQHISRSPDYFINYTTQSANYTTKHIKTIVSLTKNEN